MLTVAAGEDVGTRLLEGNRKLRLEKELATREAERPPVPEAEIQPVVRKSRKRRTG